ncbi:hypothetical protein ABDD95_01900 [Mucilaginibacter sp. PAMB04274]|uniref:hypothetical protein n=1 Tax=Mucilaginibacter sp. PAMB04274 TaxID=3138568 RepID=UPI0031F641B2
MKTLLIPTDFDLKSLNCVPGLARRYAPEKVNIILVHMMKITDNIQELLMLSRRSTDYQHISEDFYNTCTEIRHSNAAISSIKVEFFYGSTVAVFKNFLEAQEVDAIVMLENYEYRMLNKNSIQPSLLVSRSGLPLIHTDCATTPKLTVVKTDEALVEESV